MGIDVMTLGEAMLRLTPPGFRRLEQSTTLEIHVAGSELNTAVGLARLGLRVTWISRLTKNAPGHLIERAARNQNVDTRHILWTDEDRVGIYYMEEGKAPRASEVTYDRANSAMSRIQPSDLNLEALLADPPRLLHLTGITLALSESSAATAAALFSACKARGIPMSFDLNYRSRLWDAASAQRTCEPFMQAAALLFVPARDAQALYGDADPAALHARYPHAALIMTNGAAGATAIMPDGQQFHQPVFPTEIVCRVGGGDAFSAGFLYAHLSGLDMQACLRYGAAAAALKYSLPGDMPLIDLEMVQKLAQQGQSGDIVR